MNTDGIANGCQSPASSGGMFRDSFRVVRGCFALRVEIFAAMHAIERFWILGWSSLWLESDSQMMVHLLQKHSSKDSWKWYSRWMNYLMFISQICFKVSYVFHKGNGVVDTLSKMGVSYTSFDWCTCLLEICIKAHRDDILDDHAYRFC